MAMLAEPRRKQKFSVDPRNISWSNDDGKIGQKLMEKMGWSKGKGLGANEDGKTEHVAVNVKNDTRGVGCSKNHADNWIAHQDDFNSLLASLNQENNSTPNSDVEKVISLEHKSKTAKGRLHYQKFTKGKDLSLKSGQDLDCVFGKRKSHSGSNTPLPGSESGSEDDDKLHGIQTVTSTDSIQDYFKKKMADRKNRLENESKSAVPGNQNNISDNDFEENAHGLVCIKQEQETVDIFKTKMSKKKKSKKSKDCLMNSNLNEAVIETIVDGESEPSTEPVKKPKKKTKRKKEEIKNEITDISCDNVKEEFDASAEGKVKKKSKKRKKEKCKKSDGSDVKFVIGCEVDDDGDQPIKKKHTMETNGESSLLVQTDEDRQENNKEASEIFNIESGEDLSSGKCDTNTQKSYVNTPASDGKNSTKNRRKPKRQRFKRPLSGKKCNIGFPGANLDSIHGYVGFLCPLPGSRSSFKVKG